MVDSSDMMGLDVKVGNPWSILPIKNNKYAKDLVEVHLSDRGLNALEKFEMFPNLEVIWLNNNSVSKQNAIFWNSTNESNLFAVTKLGWHIK